MGVNTNETLNIDLVVEFVSNLLIELLFFVPSMLRRRNLKTQLYFYG